MTKLTYVIRYVADMDRAIEFYEKELGLPIKFRSPFWTEFDTGSTSLALHPASEKNPPGSAQIGFGIPDIDEFYAAKSAAGLEFTSPPTPQFGAKIARFKDIDGAECSIGSREKGS